MHKVDPRVLKTKMFIREALIRLLEEKDFHAVSTKEIIDAARINRNTFYKYYRSKNDLAVKLAEQLKAEFRLVMTAFFKRDFHRHEQEADRSLFEQRRLILVLWNINMRSCRLYRDMLDIAAQCFIEYVQTQYPEPADKDWHYQANMFAGIVLSTTDYYFRKNKPLPTTLALLELKEMTAILCKDK